MATTSFARRNVSGSSAAARARFVIGPSPTIVIVSGSFSRKIFRISLCAGSRDGIKDVDALMWLLVRSGPNWSFQVSSGERWGCYDLRSVSDGFFEYLTYTVVHTAEAINSI